MAMHIASTARWRHPPDPPAGIPTRHRGPRALLGAVLGCALSTAAAADGLQAGARIADCASALRVGPVHCASPDDAGDPADALAAPDAATASAQAALEAQVDDYLRQYGKPPREAVRALLDPSDRNIQRYLAKQQQMLAVVAYVAERMSRMQAALDAPAPPAAAVAPDLARTMQMRLTLVMRIEDPSAQAALRALRELALQAPALQAGVQLVGTLDAQQLRAAVAQVPAPLIAFAADTQMPSDEDLPYIRVDDLRSGRTIRVDARSATAAALQESIDALRGAAAPPGAAAGAP